MLELQVHLVLLQVDTLDPFEEESVSALFADLLKECHPAHQLIDAELDSEVWLLDQPWAMGVPMRVGGTAATSGSSVELKMSVACSDPSWSPGGRGGSSIAASSTSSSSGIDTFTWKRTSSAASGGAICAGSCGRTGVSGSAGGDDPLEDAVVLAFDKVPKEPGRTHCGSPLQCPTFPHLLHVVLAFRVAIFALRSSRLRLPETENCRGAACPRNPLPF